jgi:hypothetical protein
VHSYLHGHISVGVLGSFVGSRRTASKVLTPGVTCHVTVMLADSRDLTLHRCDEDEAKLSDSAGTSISDLPVTQD